MVTAIAHYLSTSQTARELEISQEGVRHLVRIGQLQAIETVNGRLYDPQEVLRLKRERAEKQSQGPEI
jgi:DNA-binding transcriptional MerR regulator